MSKINEVTIKPDDLISAASLHLNKKDIKELERTIIFATKAHNGQKRMSGANYITHPLAVALSIAELRMDVQAIQASLLHDTLEDCGIQVEQLVEEFGEDVCQMVQGVTKFEEIHSEQTKQDVNSETMKKMFLAMAEDVRVVIIKIADRLHNMQTLEYLPKNRQLEISNETMEIFAPLADRLGIWQYKWQLEDLAFSYLESDISRRINSMISVSLSEREKYIAKIIKSIKNEFQHENIDTEIHGRAKHVYSIYKKMQRYTNEGKSISEIYDLFAVRIIVNSIPDCYAALGVVHQAWRPIPGSFDDYIANSKDSLYQSIHTNVIGPDNKPLEVQIKTKEMHQVAEIGVAAHWKYKEEDLKNIDPKFEQRLLWLRNILDRQMESTDTEDFIASIKNDLFKDQIFVYTPNNDIKMLPKGSTPVDFAFSVHTQLGFYCFGAKVNGGKVSLKYKLENGDIVEIIRSDNEKGPSRYWLNESEGYLGSDHSKQKVRQWFRKFEKQDNIDKGKSFLFYELDRLNIDNLPTNFANIIGYNKLDDLYAGIGYGDVSNKKIVQKLFDYSKEFKIFSGDKKSNYSATVQIKLNVNDRIGMLQDLTTVISSSGVNMVEVKTKEHDDKTTDVFIVLKTDSSLDFANLFYNLDAIKDVFKIERVKNQK